jgi:cytoskeletal protein RodZ
MTKEERGWPTYLLRGRIRTSTVALILAFFLVWWLYQEYKPAPPPVQAPATEIVPPGFVPDPNYTWVPRTNVQEPRRTTTTISSPTSTTTLTTTPTESTTPSGTTTSGTTTSGSPTTAPTTTTPPPPGAPTSSPASAAPGPGPSPSPSR